jgi:hypothetical protein
MVIPTGPMRLIAANNAREHPILKAACLITRKSIHRTHARGMKI